MANPSVEALDPFRMKRLLCLMFAPLASYAADTFMVENGQPNAEIIIAEKPTRSVKLAANELQTFIEKISGGRLPIVTAPTGELPLKIYVGESEQARRAGVDTAGLKRDAFRMASGPDWLALVGEDLDFTPIEPWARSKTDWEKNKEAEWQKLSGHPWLNAVGSSLYKDYNKQLDIWAQDHRGSLNAVYAFLRDLGVRWYMPGELGEIVPKAASIALPVVNRTAQPEFEVRTVSRPSISSPSADDALWYLRIGANEQYGVLHHATRVVTEPAAQRERHPEYYALLPNGTRDIKSARPSACLSSPGFVQEMAAYARLMFDHYDMPICSVMPEDGFNHCQCDLCKGQETLDRGPSGSSSDYVWSYVVRVANELAKTHPDRKVLCGAYSSYRLPPRTIAKLPDNVWVQITNGRPIREMDDVTHESTATLRREWLAKTSHPLSVTLNYTPFTNKGDFRPQYWPHVIARGMRATAGTVWREDVWISSHMGGLHFPGMSHLNPYIMSQLWLDAKQDVDALLKEYYTRFYGPAAAQMQAFIEYCEPNFGQMGGDPGVIRKALDLFDQAKAAAPSGSVHAQRIALVDEFLTTMRDRGKQIAVERPAGLPQCRILDMGTRRWQDVSQTLKIDGRLDEPFWTASNFPQSLKDARTGKKPERATRFMARWWKDSLYLGIQCEGAPGVAPIVGGTSDGDPAIWDGEHIELLIETDKHSYYQLVINPDGHIIHLDRGVAKAHWRDWSSQAEVKVHRDGGSWSAEIRLPVTSSDEDPLHQIVGSRPFKSKDKALHSGKGTNLPWHFNLFRKRAGSEDEEITSFSPLGPNAKTFHDPQRFSEIYVQ